MNVGQAKKVAFGSQPSNNLQEYFDAWQWLYDNKIELKEPDIRYLDKLICDGSVIPRKGYFDILDK
jgi:hypothetical protein